MDIAKVTAKGQITIPLDIRQKMALKTGDKVVFLEEHGRYWLENSAAIALVSMQDEMKGKAKKAGFNKPAEVIKYIKGIRNNKDESLN